MPNTNYQRSANRERKIMHDFQKEGYYAIRASGSHGLADVIAMRPGTCTDPEHFEVKFVQIKVSEKLRVANKTVKAMEGPFGFVNIEFWKFPVKSKKWHARTKKKTKK